MHLVVFTVYCLGNASVKLEKARSEELATVSAPCWEADAKCTSLLLKTLKNVQNIWKLWHNVGLLIWSLIRRRWKFPTTGWEWTRAARGINCLFIFLFFYILNTLNKWHKWMNEWMNEWMNNSRLDDSDFMIAIPAYSCRVCQHLSHAHKWETLCAQTKQGWIIEWARITQEVTGPWSPSSCVKSLPQKVRKQKVMNLWIFEFKYCPCPAGHPQKAPEYRKSHLPNSEFCGGGPPYPPSPLCTHFLTNKVGGPFQCINDWEHFTHSGRVTWVLIFFF